MPDAGIKMKRFPLRQHILMLAHRHFHLSGQDIHKLFAFMLVSDAFMISAGDQWRPECFQVFIFCPPRQGRIGIVFGSLDICPDAAFQIGFLLFQ
jgi:hypothetical protein